MTPDDIRTLFEAHGLGEWSDWLISESVPSMDITLKRDDDPPLGVHRIGGAPDLPDGVDWPTSHGVPLAFIAQFDLADLASDEPCKALPSRGMLFFFYEAVASPWGFDPKDKGGWRVIYCPDSPWVRRQLPEELGDESIFPPCRASLTSDLAFGPYPCIIDDDLDEQVGESLSEMRPMPGLSSHLLGYPIEVQGPMQEQCAIVSGGIYLGGTEGWSDPRVPELERDAENWILLLQVGSESEAKMMWGDEGSLYFWIRKQDLAARNFNDVWLVLQCG